MLPKPLNQQFTDISFKLKQPSSILNMNSYFKKIFPILLLCAYAQTSESITFTFDQIDSSVQVHVKPSLYSAQTTEPWNKEKD